MDIQALALLAEEEFFMKSNQKYNNEPVLLL